MGHRVIAPRARRLFVEQWAVIGRLNAHVEETYSGLPLVKTFGQRARAQERFRDLNAGVYRASFGAEFLSGLISPAAEFIANLNYVAVAVLGGMQVASGHITLGSVQAFIQYVRQFNQPVIQIASMYYVAQSGWRAPSGSSSCWTPRSRNPTPRRRCRRPSSRDHPGGWSSSR
ncbi:hypothetical protein NIIDMKKI_49650 [Mycobacterium kansasii]|uniref:ABC transmembrane type-1 domain-containing protein n=1 Tax=Mycobacterium kansasii TaxID=1768 RepID=A0A7G1IIZ8_MYCKA|nr:hypothetical protein NIIDMKKI_49650 [Mycobacterium kansasii]